MVIDKLKVANTPRVTVLMPVHGEAPYIRETIDSVLNQTYSNFIFLIVSDRASQACLELIYEMGKADSRIELLESDRPGISAALNLGLDVSDDTFFARIDCDDLMSDCRLATQVDFLQKNPHIDMVGSQVKYIGEVGANRTFYPKSPRRISQALRIRNVIAHPSVMYRRESILGVGGYDSSLNGSEDYDLWLRLDSGHNIQNLPLRLTSYRIHENQETKKNSSHQMQIDNYVREMDYSRRKVNLRHKKRLLRSATIMNEMINHAKKLDLLNILNLISESLKVLILTPSLSFIFFSSFVMPRLLKHVRL